MEEPVPLKLNENGFDKFDLFRIRVTGDGNCYFHAFAMAYIIPYKTQNYKGKIIRRVDLVRGLRKDLSLRLTAKVNPEDQNSPMVYETLGNGHVAEMGLTTKELSLETMIRHIDSDEWCGEEVQELVSNETNKNIFYINVREENVYITSDINILYKDRDSVVLLVYDNKHYDTCAVRNKHGEYITHFCFKHQFIQFLYNRLKEQKKQQF